MYKIKNDKYKKDKSNDFLWMHTCICTTLNWKMKNVTESFIFVLFLFLCRVGPLSQKVGCFLTKKRFSVNKKIIYFTIYNSTIIIIIIIKGKKIFLYIYIVPTKREWKNRMVHNSGIIID